MKIEDQKQINDICRETLSDLEKCIDRMADASAIALKARAFSQAHSLMRKAEMCDGLRAEVSISVSPEERKLPTPVVATGHEPTKIKA